MNNLLTKSDLREELAPIKSEITLLKGMVGFTLAAIMAVLDMLVKR
jgi:hypothetical protein